MTSKCNLVSVIIPLYNCEKFIAKTIASIFNQSYSEIEIIVVDDGSTDNSLEICKSLSDSRITIVSQQNQGCSSAKNNGLKLAKGAFIQFMDADDLLSRDKIASQVSILDKYPNSIAVCETQYIDENDQILVGSEFDNKVIRLTSAPLDFWKNLNGKLGRYAMVQPNAFLTPRSIVNSIGPWDETISRSPAEDGEYFTRALLAAKHVLFTEGINFYRKGQSYISLSRGQSKENAIGLFETIRKKFNHIFQLEYSEEVQKLYVQQLTQCAYQFGIQYPEIIDMVEIELKIHNNSRFDFIENGIFSIVSSLTNFRTAIKLKKITNRIY